MNPIDSRANDAHEHDAEWIPVLAEDALGEGEVVGVEAHGEEIAVYCVQGELHATSDLCTHGFARMSEGFLEGCEIECPIHQGRFDVRTGEPTCGPVTEPLRRHAVRREDGRIWIRLDQGAG